MVPLDRADIDTDQIMPKQFLKRVQRTGFGEFVFHDWRGDDDFPLNDEDYEGANVLVTGPNFGCGSSREHAPWGLQQYGLDAIVAPGFGDIFRSNCAKTGLLTVVLPVERVRALMDLAGSDPRATIRIDLPEQRVVTAAGNWGFDLDPDVKQLLVGGIDEIAMTLQRADDIAAFASSRPRYMPVTAR